MGQPGDPSNLGNGTRTNNKCTYYFTTVVAAKKSKNRSGRWTVNFLAHLLPQFITVEPAPPPSSISGSHGVERRRLQCGCGSCHRGHRAMGAPTGIYL